jgi:flagellum-specific peptidoglycan hydrolase FlgJ
LVDPLILVRAVAKLETQDGRKAVGAHNLFNIKDPTGKGPKAVDKAEGSNHSYRSYASRQESIDDFIGLLGRRYPEAHKALQEGDVAGFVAGLVKRGYATDPEYRERRRAANRASYQRKAGQ